MINFLLILIYFAIIGRIIHGIIGKHGSTILHWTFVGGCGSGLGAALEWITGRYTTTFAGALCLSLACTLAAELIIRRIEKYLYTKYIHSKGWLTQDDIDLKFNIRPDDLENCEDVEVE